jgi:ubiquinol-cytochrome c reductase cytochrome b subunit
MTTTERGAAKRSWTAGLRRAGMQALPPERLLPDEQPVYVASWVYVFGVLTIAALVIVIGSGVVLALKGPTWWHVSSVGLFFNSVHVWSVELFFFFMVVHLWAKFFMAAWRGRRALTWVTGAVSFVVSIGAAFTGYLSQQNFASQWIASQAKDGLNSVGIGAFFNVLDFGQMFTWHVVLLPLGIVVLVVAHVLLVRKHGVVPPLPIRSEPATQTTAPVPERDGR